MTYMLWRFLHAVLVLYVAISYVTCVVENIDSKTSAGVNAYIWLVKSPNILSQSINEPTRYSYGLLSGSIISLDLDFEVWDTPEQNSLFVGEALSRDEEEATKGNAGGEERVEGVEGRVKGRNKKSSENESRIGQERGNLLFSGVPLLRFEDLPLSCIFSLKSSKISRLVGDLSIANSDDIFIGIKWKNGRGLVVIKRFIRRLVLYWRSVIRYIMPKWFGKSSEKRCMDYISTLLQERASDFLELNKTVRTSPWGEKNLTFFGDMHNSGKNDVKFEERIRLEAENKLPKREFKNLFLLLLNSEQLIALNHSPVQDLALASFSAISPRYNVSTYLRSILRVPIKGGSLKLSYKVPRTDRYTLLVVNGDKIPLHIKGKVILKNPFPLNHLSFERRMDSKIANFMLGVHLATIIAYLAFSIYRYHAALQGYGREIHIKFNSLEAIGLVLLLTKLASLYFDRLNLMTFMQLGNVRFTSWFLPRVLSRIFETLLLMYMVLISLGWRVLRDNLLSIEAKLLVGFFVVLLYLGVFEVVLGIFQIARYFFHAIASLCIIIATNINTTLLQNTISEQSISPRLGILYSKWKAYSNFKWIFGIFILKPSILFFWRVFTLEPNGMDDWIYVVLDSIIDYLILITIMITFRPFKSSRLFNQILAKNESNSNNNLNFDVSMWPIIM
ncbi:lung seven transmembrane receptor [Cryptosporidium felis]|nr:lung seven transmembrane receptor [Cryptosporidium felis]